MKIVEVITESIITEARELNELFSRVERAIDVIALHEGVDAETLWESVTDNNNEVDVDLLEQFLESKDSWAKHNNPRAGGMSKKSVSSYRRSHPGSKIQTAVTTKPSKLKKGSKSAKRRKSFCARMRGMKKHRTGAKTARDPNSNINKSLRRWNC
jgi:hypothetical protein